MVDRERAQSLMNYDYPRDWDNYNNSACKYNAKFSLIKPSVLTHAMVKSVPYAYT